MKKQIIQIVVKKLKMRYLIVMTNSNLQIQMMNPIRKQTTSSNHTMKEKSTIILMRRILNLTTLMVSKIKVKINKLTMTHKILNRKKRMNAKLYAQMESRIIIPLRVKVIRLLILANNRKRKTRQKVNPSLPNQMENFGKS